MLCSRAQADRAPHTDRLLPTTFGIQTLGRLRVAFAISFALVMFGCAPDDTHYDPDGGMDVMVVETNSLEVLSEISRTLREGESGTVRAQYLDVGGRPIADAELRFALNGTANDSTLSQLVATTDNDGIAQATLVAGGIPATFRVRVSATDAAPVYVSVSVSDSGFGRLAFTPIYQGRREGTLGAAVVTGASCDEERARTERTRYRELDSMDDAVEFGGLPARTPLAVVGRLESEEGVLLAWSCEDGVMIEPELTHTLEGVLEDIALQPAGTYDIDTRFSAVAIADAFASDDRLYIDDAGSLLDALRVILEESDPESGEALAAERAAGLDTTFAASLPSGVGPSAALDSISELLNRVLDEVVLGAELRIGDELTTMTRSLRIGGFDVSDPELMTSASVEGGVDGEDESIDIERYALTLPGGALARVLVEAAANEAGLTPLAWMQQRAQCEMMPSPLEVYCDDACAIAMCEASIEGLVERLDELYASLDDTLVGIDFKGPLQLTDDDGDLQPDTLSGSLEGRWAGTEEVLRADVEGMRVTAPR